jgi:hypothetical protein
MKNLYDQLGRVVVALVLLTAASFANAGESSANDDRPGILKSLDGNWLMSGDVMGRAATYAMVAAPALQATFTEIRMKDVNVPPKYEAAVFLGYNAGSQTILVHWMDKFGAQASVPHATGDLAGNTVQFIFPYKSGRFRNIWTYHPETSSWDFVLESEQNDGSWKHFARYKVNQTKT